mgnify:FL=1
MPQKDTAAPALVLKIEELLPSLSKSEQSVGAYIVQHPDEVINLSVAALAENAKVSEPTVVRACRRLGFTGYQDLKVTLAQSIVTPMQSVHEQVTAQDDMQTLASKVFGSATHTLEFTYDTLCAADLEAAAKLLMSARRILIFGVGASGAIVSDAQHKLLRLGLNANAYTDPHLQAMTASYATADDVILAISHSGSSRIVVDNVQLAKNNGARIISLTNIGRSPLSKLADICLYTASRETKYRILAVSSRIAELTIIDCIYTYIAIRSQNGRDLKVEKAMEWLKY